MLLLIDNYDSFTYNLAQYLGQLGADVRVVRNDALGLDDIATMAPTHIVISPGPCTPDEAGISVATVRRFAGEIPILGVCLGHQSIAQAFGGRIVRAGEVMHGKLSQVFHDDRGLFTGVRNPMRVTRYHSLVVAPESIPDCLEVTAKTWRDEIMGLRHRGYAGTHAPVEGLQFHPESIETAAGTALLGAFLATGRGSAAAAPSPTSSTSSSPALPLPTPPPRSTPLS
ncbi:anthranilate synthase component II [Haliangium ochraceum]|uniref:Glutamine amidotransferase of anthranilate synthase n=1 Tax=Haliangium ochraceum (strain DSM 14365 / JCM 11303 / SMP-2) TaxID=502025 RepID=D0LX40_HALO1|nr:aminodeoxychorismate/anthranilate synthase component II [Haliangium ochraceum]ACY16082.1 glutamine amidotransferase of anthranilate synthase [Haliangium ochraceum DSM 14365]